MIKNVMSWNCKVSSDLVNSPGRKKAEKAKQIIALKDRWGIAAISLCKIGIETSILVSHVGTSLLIANKTFVTSKWEQGSGKENIWCKNEIADNLVLIVDGENPTWNK